MIDIEEYKKTCALLSEYIRKGRGGIYIGGYDVLGANVIGQQLIVDSRHAPSIKRLYAPPPSEAFVLAFMLQWIKAGMVCVDVDAGCGYYAILMASVAGPSGKIFAFEPIPECEQLIFRNIELNDLTTVEVVANYVSDENKNVNIEYFGADYRFFFLNAKQQVKRNEIVESIILDEFLANEASVDFVKINRDTNIIPIFKGMHELMLFNADLSILCPFNCTKLAASISDVSIFLDEMFLKQHYKAYALPYLTPVDKDDLLNQTITKNILFTRQ